MQRQWLIEAEKYNVLPIDDRRFERINPDLAGRPQLVRGKSQLLFDGMRVTENSVLTLKNKSHAVTAEVHDRQRRRGGADHPGRRRRRLVAVRQGRQVEVLLQLLRHPALLRRIDGAHPDRQAPAAHGVRIRRGRRGQGRRRHAVHRRQSGGPGPGRSHHPDGLLRRRGLRRGPRHRLPRPPPTTAPTTTPSPATSPGSSSTSATTTRTT